MMFLRMSQVLRAIMAVCLLLTMSVAAVPASNSFAQESGKVVNIQLVVDSSGSMAAATPNGELRVDAAKRVLTQVISEIPAVDGVNVGYRVYGHLGNNQADGKPVSCESSELTVPMDGVNVPALTQQVDSLTPTGWTPLGFSLEQAGLDFMEPASSEVVNAIIMLTDGLETCGGDPVAVAAALNSSDEGIVTHVIGFGTTAEEQAVLQGIASSGGGLLLGANDAGELTDALFDVLEELEVVQGVGFIGGNGLGLLGPGDPGEISVLTYGPYDGTSLPVVIRNNSGQDIIRPAMTVTARNSTGQIVAVGADQMFNPNLVRSGGVSIGYAYFDLVEIPVDATFEFSFSPTPASQDEFENIRDLEVVEASNVNGAIVGTLQNTYGVELQGPFSTAAACLDANGQVLTTIRGYEQVPSIAVDATIPFQAANYSGQPCDYFLVAASGWDNSFGPNNSVEPPSSATPTSEAEIASSPQPDLPEEQLGTPEASTPNDSSMLQGTPVDSRSDGSSPVCPDLSSPESILLAMQSQQLPIGDYVVYDASTDPNELLGRPLQYTGKLNFRDTRLTTILPNEFDFNDGGSIEIFANEEDAQARYDHVMMTIREFPSLTHYVYVEGTVLVRVSGRLTPDQAAEYEQSLTSFIGCTAAMPRT